MKTAHAPQMGLSISQDPRTDAEREADEEEEGDAQKLLFAHLVSACKAVARDLGYDACANALDKIWAKEGHPVSSSVLRAALNDSRGNYFRVEWAIWFARKSDEVAELLLEIGGSARPKKKAEDELRDLQALVREEMPKRAAAIIRKAELL